MLNHWRVHLLSGRKFSTKIHEELTCRLATSSDFDNVVKLSTGIFNGYDCIPVVFHEWLKKENIAIMLLFAGRSLIGLSASCIVDEGKTFVRRFDRITPSLRGQGLQRKIFDALHEHVQTNFPNVSRERFTSFLDLTKVITGRTAYQILERDQSCRFLCRRNQQETLTDIAIFAVFSIKRRNLILSRVPKNTSATLSCPHQ